MIKNPLLAIAMLTAALTPALHSQTRTIRIIFGTTPNVRNSHGGTSNVNADIQTKYRQIIDNHDNSATSIRWRRSDTFNATYNNRNQTAGTQLSRLGTGSQLSGFRRARNRADADLAQLYCDWTNGNVAGGATQPGEFSVVRNNTLSTFSNRTNLGTAHIHEVGHNLNGSHGQGYCFSNNRHTIMEVGSCVGASRRLVFSSNTRRLGGNSGARIGNNSHNNRTRVRNRRTAASRLR